MGRTIKVRIGNWKFGFRFWFQKVYDRTGVTNETQDGMFVPFFDFRSGTTLDNVVHSLTHLQKEFGLSTAYIIQSYPRESYRAFTTDKVDFRENIQILTECDWLDENYLRSFVRRKRSVLRVVSKKERGEEDRIVDILPNGGHLRDRSDDHEIFLMHRFYGHFVFDHDLRVMLSRYESFA